MTNVHDVWVEFQKKIDDEKGNLSEFKTWDIVRRIPLYHYSEYAKEYATESMQMIKRNPREDVWMKLFETNEPFLGHTTQSYEQAQVTVNDLPTTPFRLKSLHHCLTIEEMLGKSILEYDYIVEFGAGIGETARTIFDYGFKGQYHIVDLPSTSKLSQYYLEGFNCQCYENISDIKETALFNANVLFIATWSLSETPLAYRNEIAKYVKGKDYLIISQRQFREIDNFTYFLDQWPYFTNSFYRVRSLGFHKGDGGNVYIAGKSC